MAPVLITYIGGPTALIEYGGLRFLTDPTFDPDGTDYPATGYALHKIQAPALLPAALGTIDAVLLSHDHHFDNLDHAGRATLPKAGKTLTTRAGAQRLGTNAVGLDTWESVDLATPSGRTVRVTATPARHGPPNGDRGPVNGFVLSTVDGTEAVVYFSGDTVWFEGVAEVGRRFRVDIALLNLGAAEVPVAGPHPLTFTAAEAVKLAQEWPRVVIVPLHFEGWAHFTEGAAAIAEAFAGAGLSSNGRLHWLARGIAVQVGGGRPE